MANESEYKCLSCGWLGTDQDIDFETTETCFGEDKIEICPKCGSMEIKISFVQKDR